MVVANKEIGCLAELLGGGDTAIGARCMSRQLAVQIMPKLGLTDQLHTQQCILLGVDGGTQVVNLRFVCSEPGSKEIVCGLNMIGPRTGRKETNEPLNAARLKMRWAELQVESLQPKAVPEQSSTADISAAVRMLEEVAGDAR
jgi:hypothetical protein